MPKSLPSQLRFVSVFACGLFVVAALALSQSAPQTTQAQQPASGSRQPDDSQEPTTTLKINVNVVQLFFNVKDKHGTLIPNLTKNDFEISEDGKPQTIKYFTPESNLPLTLGMMIDSSGSQQIGRASCRERV